MRNLPGEALLDFPSCLLGQNHTTWLFLNNSLARKSVIMVALNITRCIGWGGSLSPPKLLRLNKIKTHLARKKAGKREAAVE